VGLLGLAIGGVLGDRLRERGPNGRLLLAAFAFLAAAPCVFLALEQPKGHFLAFASFMAAMTVLTFVYYSTVYSAIQDVVEPRLRGAAVALYFFAMYVLGASFGPVIVGALSDRMALKAMEAAGAAAMTESFRATGLHSAMYVIPVVLLATSLVLFAAARTVGADMERMQERLRTSFL
jgi:MFS family permease